MEHIDDVPILFIYDDITHRSMHDARKQSYQAIHVCQKRIAGLWTAPIGFIDMQLYGGIASNVINDEG